MMSFGGSLMGQLRSTRKFFISVGMHSGVRRLVLPLLYSMHQCTTPCFVSELLLSCVSCACMHVLKPWYTKARAHIHTITWRMSQSYWNRFYVVGSEVKLRQCREVTKTLRVCMHVSMLALRLRMFSAIRCSSHVHVHVHEYICVCSWHVSQLSRALAQCTRCVSCMSLRAPSCDYPSIPSFMEWFLEYIYTQG